MQILQTMPILRIFDVARGARFLPRLSRLPLGLGAPPRCSVGCRALEGLHQELAAKPHRYQRPGIETAPWNARLMKLTDPSGNRVRLNEDLI